LALNTASLRWHYPDQVTGSRDNSLISARTGSPSSRLCCCYHYYRPAGTGSKYRETAYCICIKRKTDASRLCGCCPAAGTRVAPQGVCRILKLISGRLAVGEYCDTAPYTIHSSQIKIGCEDHPRLTRPPPRPGPKGPLLPNTRSSPARPPDHRRWPQRRIIGFR
jgi:hypothetical protein